MKNQNYIVEYNGEPVTRLKFQSDGKADISTGYIMDAIWYTAEEASEVAAAIGKGAEVVEGNMTAKQQAAITVHGQNLLATFPNASERDPVKLCKKLHRLEVVAHRGATAYCNGTPFVAGIAGSYTSADYVYRFGHVEDDWAGFVGVILGKVNSLLGNHDKAVPVFVNGDARGYALKIDSDYVREEQRKAAAIQAKGAGLAKLHCDWGGYGIIAPEIGLEG